MCPTEGVDHDAPLTGSPVLDLTVNEAATAANVVPVELNPALLSADPRGYDAYQDNADEDGSIPGTSTPGTGPTWHHSCSVSCQVQALLVSKCIATPAATPSETEILNTMIFSLTTDPHTPVKLSVEQNEICRRGSTGGLLRSELLGRIWRSC